MRVAVVSSGQTVVAPLTILNRPGPNCRLTRRRGAAFLLYAVCVAASAEPTRAVTNESRPPTEAHWAFLAPIRPPIPAVRNHRWVRNPIDAFVLARLERQGITPSPEADRRTLIRRLCLDLTGLPPTPEQVEPFVGDSS